MVLGELSYNNLFHGRSERLISVARLVLAAFFLLAVFLDPSEPAVYSRTTLAILQGYFLYALALALLVWRQRNVRGQVPVFLHVVDFAIFAVVMFLTEGVGSPFFVYFVFMLVCATVRWQWRGTLWTAGAALITALFLSWGTVAAYGSPVEWNRFIIRISYLIVVASLLGYLGAHEQQTRRMLARLASWPGHVSTDARTLAREALTHAAGIMTAPRLLLVWEEKEEPWLYTALLAGGEVCFRRENPGAYGTFVAERLSAAGFFSPDAGAAHPLVVQSSGRLRGWGAESPLTAPFRERFAISSILCVPVAGAEFDGYLMALDLHDATTDDLVLGSLVANEIAIRLEHHFLLRELQSAAAGRERVRLLHDLHDGLLQSLTVASLRLETGRRLLEIDPQEAQQHFSDVQQLIASEQRALRSQVQEMKRSLDLRHGGKGDLAGRLRELAERLKRHWGVDVQISTKNFGHEISRELSHEIYFVVHESLINAARHSGASSVHAGLSVCDGRLVISVADDGQGFPFRGRHDHAALDRLNVGPVSLKARAAALGGSVTVDSREDGSTIEILIPLRSPGDEQCRYD